MQSIAKFGYLGCIFGREAYKSVCWRNIRVYSFKKADLTGRKNIFEVGDKSSRILCLNLDILTSNIGVRVIHSFLLTKFYQLFKILNTVVFGLAQKQLYWKASLRWCFPFFVFIFKVHKKT
jgi:hypothetical protein